MTDAPTISAQGEARLGPGRMILVVGPSGAGKDTLLGLARTSLAEDGRVVFQRRVVTREASSAEDNDEMSQEAFRQARSRGEFAVHWEAHGHYYALPRAIDDEIGAGRTVVANVSRAIVDAMCRTYADVTVVSITAPPEVLAYRLAARSRGSDGKLADRLGRAVDEAAPDVIITNIGDAQHHAAELARIIRGE
jgi:ribose 1,5-bisphosphokinase